MNYLAIDTSGKSLVVVLSFEGKTHVHFDKECGAKHSVTLMPVIEQTLQEANASLSQLDFLACVVGAGSFTGIRIGVSTVKALCFAFQLPCLSITSFDCIAYNKKADKVMSVIDAKHDGFYVCGYQDLKEVLPPSYILKEQLLQYQTEYQFLSAEPIDGLDCEVCDVVEGLISAIEQKKNDSLIDADLLTPLYVRKSQAEEGR